MIALRPAELAGLDADDHRRVGQLDDARQLALGQPAHDTGWGMAPTFQQATCRDEPLDRAGQRDRHEVARLHARGDEPVGHAVGPPFELGPGDVLVAAGDRGAVGGGRQVGQPPGVRDLRHGASVGPEWSRRRKWRRGAGRSATAGTTRSGGPKRPEGERRAGAGHEGGSGGGERDGVRPPERPEVAAGPKRPERASVGPELVTKEEVEAGSGTECDRRNDPKSRRPEATREGAT